MAEETYGRLDRLQPHQRNSPGALRLPVVAGCRPSPRTARHCTRSSTSACEMRERASMSALTLAAAWVRRTPLRTSHEEMSEKLTAVNDQVGQVKGQVEQVRRSPAPPAASDHAKAVATVLTRGLVMLLAEHLAGAPKYGRYGGSRRQVRGAARGFGGLLRAVQEGEAAAVHQESEGASPPPVCAAAACKPRVVVA